MPTAKSGAPHLRGPHSVPRMIWTVNLALLPVLLAQILVLGFSAFRILAVSSAAGLLAEAALRQLLGKRQTLYDGTALLSSLLFALFVPPALASWKVALGAAFGIIFGKQIFGGLGQNPLNPALAGAAFIYCAFPDSAGSFQNLPGPFASTLLWSAVLLGGILLLFTQIVRWEIPLLYLAGYFLFCLALGGDGGQALEWPVLVSAFFLVTDPVTTPLTRNGQQRFAAAAGILAPFFSKIFGPFQGVAYSVLLMNALNPRFDRHVKLAKAKK